MIEHLVRHIYAIVYWTVIAIAGLIADLITGHGLLLWPPPWRR